MFYKLKIDSVGINKFEMIVSQNQLGVKLKRKRIITTHGVYEDSDVNLINGLELTGINQVISGDITYLKQGVKTYYIYTLKDMYSKRIVGLYGSDNLRAASALEPLKQTIKLRGKSIANCIHHSDAGSQYKANIYKNKLKQNKMRMSIAENCLENGMAEQLNGLIKNNYIHTNFKNLNELNKMLKKIKSILNEEIPVKALKYKTPLQFEEELKTIRMDKRMKIKLYDFNKEKLN
jgi:transposase InsO family protein